MDKLVAKVAAANPGIAVDTESITDSDLVAKLLLYALMERNAGKQDNGGGKGVGGELTPATSVRRGSKPSEPAEDAQLSMFAPSIPPDLLFLHYR